MRMKFFTHPIFDDSPVSPNHAACLCFGFPSGKLRTMPRRTGQIVAQRGKIAP